MHRKSSLNTVDHERIELDHVWVFLLFFERSKTLEDRETCIDHGCKNSEKYHLLTELDRDTWLDKVLYVDEYSFFFSSFFSFFDVEDDDILIIGHG